MLTHVAGFSIGQWPVVMPSRHSLVSGCPGKTGPLVHMTPVQPPILATLDRMHVQVIASTSRTHSEVSSTSHNISQWWHKTE
jgi:hypothetical protein